jgi:hypothetical protein
VYATHVRAADFVSSQHANEDPVFQIIYDGQGQKIVFHEQFQGVIERIVRGQRSDTATDSWNRLLSPAVKASESGVFSTHRPLRLNATACVVWAYLRPPNPADGFDIVRNFG